MDHTFDGFIAFLMVVVVAIVLAAIYWNLKKVSAEADYRAALKSFQADPTNSSLRQRVLERGRIYSDFTRGHYGIATYDEMAIKNDIDAACAGAVRPSDAAPALAKEEPVHAASIKERLAQLQELLAEGLITEEDYEARKQSILDEI